MRPSLAAAALAIALTAGVSRADELGPSPPPPKRPLFSKGGPYAKLQGGYTLRTLYGVPIDSGNVDVGVGGRFGIVAVYMEVNLVFGSTRAGLVVRDYDLGPTAEVALWRFHIGAGFYEGFLYVSRATSSTTLISVNFGLRAHVTFDLFQWGTPIKSGRASGVFVGVQGSLDFPGGTTDGLDVTAIYGGPTFMAGVRGF